MIGNGYGDSMFLATNGILARANAGTPPVNTVAPVISGTQVVGSSLSSTTGTWTGSPAPTFTYQWYRGATLISGATSSSYTLVQADAGNTSNITCQVTGTNAIGNSTATSNTLAQILDFDANAFITAASITDSTQKSATNTLTIDLKGYGVWTKMKALYPFVGGTSSTHKWNLKDPRDLDVAFRLVFNGGWTHSSTGALPNGTNAYADTFLIPNTQQTLTSGHFSLYSRTSIKSTDAFGGSGIRENSGLGAVLILRRGDNLKAGVMWDESTAGYVSPGAETDARGFYIISRIANNSLKFYKNNTTLGSNTNTQTTSALSTKNYYLSGQNANNSGPFTGSYDNKELAFASIGDGLTDTEAANLYTAVQAFQTTLGRQV